MTKLKIDLKNGFLEVEGEEEFVQKIYADYKDVLSLIISRQSEETTKLPVTTTPLNENLTVTPKIRKSGRSTGQTTRLKNKKSHKIIGSLNLSPEGKESFREFVEKKQPGTGKEMNTVAVYYLSKTLSLENISPDHIYSCYKNAERKVPTALIQNLRDTSSLRGWIDTSETENIKITTAGENFVEYDLPRKRKKQ